MGQYLTCDLCVRVSQLDTRGPLPSSYPASVTKLRQSSFIALDETQQLEMFWQVTYI